MTEERYAPTIWDEDFPLSPEDLLWARAKEITQTGKPPPMDERDIWAIAGFDDAAEFRVWSYELPDLAKKIISDAQVHHDVCPFRPIDVWYLEQVLEKALADELKRWQQGWGHELPTPEQVRERQREWQRRPQEPGSAYHRLEEPPNEQTAQADLAAASKGGEK